MTPVLLIGNGGHCRSCIDVIESTANYRVAGIVVSHLTDCAPVLGYPVVGDERHLADLLQQFGDALVAVGQVKSADPRIRLHRLLRQHQASLPTIVSARAHVSRHAHVGPGVIIMHGAVVNANATVGENCIVNSQALIEHDARVEAHCHISTGARLNGGVIVRSRSFIGSGATLREGIEIGCGAIIGAGQVVLEDVSAGTIVRSLM